MTAALHLVATNGTTGDLGRLLDALGRDPDERMSVCHKEGSIFRSVLTTVEQAPAVAAQHAAGDCWFGTQVLHQRVTKGRGLAVDVIGVRDLNCDLDVKPGGMPTHEAAQAVIDDLSMMLGATPVAVVTTGHGLQPHWQIERDENTDWADENDPRHLNAVALWRRWGRLVKTVARAHGGDSDSVFDVSRVMRTPGTVNRKEPTAPVRVTVAFTEGAAPVSLDAIADACGSANVIEVPTDREILGEVVVPRGSWTYSAKTCRYVARMIAPVSDDVFAEAAGWGADTSDKRHPWLLSQAVRLAAAHRLGCISEDDHGAAEQTLAARFRELMKTGIVRAEGEGEVDSAFTFGIKKVETFTDERARAELGSKDKPHQHADDIPNLPEFWATRPELAHLHTFARARLVSPWALLGVVLARVVTATTPQVALPAIVGSEASLNLFVALNGRSGGGKGASENAAADAVKVDGVETASVGSGEGIGHLYAHKEKHDGAYVLVRDRSAVLFSVPEVDNLTALGARQGATLMPQLRSAWSGEKLGFAYADPKKALVIERHTYRMGLILGVQPGRAAPLLDDADGGTPQRFLWMPTTDPDAPEDAPDCPEPLAWTVPDWRELPVNKAHLRVIAVTDTARNVIVNNRRAMLRGAGDALDGHALLTRLKTAAALALLNGRLDVNDEDWNLAGQVMAVSDATRTSVVAHLAEVAAKANEYRGESEGARAVVVAEKIEAAKVRRVSRAVLRGIVRRGGGPETQRAIAASLSSDARNVLPEALNVLADAGLIEVDSTGPKPLYRATEGAAA